MYQQNLRNQDNALMRNFHWLQFQAVSFHYTTR